MAARVLQSSVLRWTLLTAAIIGLGAVAIMAAITATALGDQAARTQAMIRDDTAALARIYSEGGAAKLAAAVTDASRAGAGLYYLGDGRGQRRAGSLGEVPAFGDGSRSGTFTYRPAPSVAPRAAVGVVLEPEAGLVLVVARDIEEQRRLVAMLTTGGALGLIALTVIAIGAGVLLARRIERRIDTISAASRTIMAGDLSQRIPRQGTEDELDRLADQLNAMLERIERLMTGMREVSDNIAHDLKTPLNRLRNRAEAALADPVGSAAWKDGLEATIERADDLIKIFNALLLIARLEAGVGDEAAELVDASEIASDVAELYAPAAEEAGFGIDLEVTPGAMIRANRQLMAQALANLVDNAIKYSAAGPAASVRDIRLGVSIDGTRVLLCVADHGPGIAAEDRARALQRFGRLEASRTRPGSGLGLNLVAAVARMHGGGVRLEDNRPGLRVVLDLPRAEEGSRAKVKMGSEVKA